MLPPLTATFFSLVKPSVLALLPPTAVGGSSASTEGFTSEKNVAVSGGSTVSKADQTEWVVYNAGGLDAAVNQTFSSYGFSLVESSQIAAHGRQFESFPPS